MSSMAAKLVISLVRRPRCTWAEAVRLATSRYRIRVSGASCLGQFLAKMSLHGVLDTLMYLSRSAQNAAGSSDSGRLTVRGLVSLGSSGSGQLENLARAPLLALIMRRTVSLGFLNPERWNVSSTKSSHTSSVTSWGSMFFPVQYLAKVLSAFRSFRSGRDSSISIHAGPVGPRRFEPTLMMPARFKTRFRRVMISDRLRLIRVLSARINL